MAPNPPAGGCAFGTQLNFVRACRCQAEDKIRLLPDRYLDRYRDQSWDKDCATNKCRKKFRGSAISGWLKCRSYNFEKGIVIISSTKLLPIHYVATEKSKLVWQEGQDGLLLPKLV
jgi:hypothetical protein